MKPSRRKSGGKRVPPAVGLTGGIASGKSEVAAVFARLGALVISADREAKAILASDDAVRRRIRALLGPSAFTAAGSPDRRFIARRIYADARARRAVNAIIHPAVTRRLRRIIAAEKRLRRVPLVAVEAALVYEAGIEGLFDVVVVVDSPVKDRIARIRKRDGLTAPEALRRIHSQQSNAVKAARAGIVIANGGDLASLRAAGRFVFRLLSGGGIPPRSAR
jgi:dephospho-CoA kinase